MAYIQMGWFSDCLGMAVQCDVILPTSDNGEKQALKTLWLIHGKTGNHHDWMRYTSLERYVQGKNLCVVMPSVPKCSDATLEYAHKIEQYISKELPQKMRTFFHLSDKQEEHYMFGQSIRGEWAFPDAPSYHHFVLDEGEHTWDYWDEQIQLFINQL